MVVPSGQVPHEPKPIVFLSEDLYCGTTHLAGGQSWHKGMCNCTSEKVASQSRPPPPG